MQKLSSATLPWATDWAAVFGVERPLIVEIGFGRGTYLVHLARQHPDHNVIGVEVSNRCLDAGERAVTRAGLTNARIVHSMGETAIHHLFEAASITQIHLNFPDPWFKTRHSHRRIMQRTTLDAMVSRLVTGGTFYLATDIREYADMSAALLESTTALDNLLPSAWTDAMPGRIITKYEQTAILEGRERHFFAYRRNTLPAPDFPVMKELPMSHLVFTSPLTLDEMHAHFKTELAGQHHIDLGTGGDTHINIMDAYRGDHALLFDVHITEPTIDQRVALLMIHRKSGDFTLQLNPLGHPRTTPGVHEAIHVLSGRLLALHPDAQMRMETLSVPD